MFTNKYLRKYYLKFMPLIIFGVASVIAVDYFQLWLPEYLGDIVTIATNNEALTFDMISHVIYGIIMVGLIIFLGRIAFRYTLFYFSLKTQAGLRHDMFLKSERLSQRYYHENKVGNIMSWFTNDLETVEEFIGWGTVMLIDAVFLTIFCLIKMFKIDWVLTLIALIPMVLIIVWGALVEKWMSIKWEERQNSFDGLYDFSQETFTGIRVIKAFVKETMELHAFSKKARKNYDANIKFVKLSVIFDVLIEGIIALINCLILCVGGYFVYQAVKGEGFSIWGHVIDMDAGALVTFLGVFDVLIWPMIAMGQIVSMYSRCKTSLKRVSNFLNQDEEIHNPVNPVKLSDVKGKISFNNYSFRYPDSEVHSLKNVTFEIAPGEIVGIVGKIGSGKSTLVNSLLRLYNVDKNSIFIDGVDIMDCDITSLRDAIAYVPQDNFLFSDKIKNNIAFSNRKIEFDKIKDAAMFADVDSNIAGFKDGYDTITGERGVTLSGGQKQRISIARAYIKDAPIMIMDDSVSAVDVKTEETILANIKEHRKNKTTIVIASRVSTVCHMDKILVLNDGEVEAFDTPANLLNTSKIYSKMVYLQNLESEVEGGAL